METIPQAAGGVEFPLYLAAGCAVVATRIREPAPFIPSPREARHGN